MKIKVKLPRGWHEVTFEQFLIVAEAKDTSEIISPFVNIAPDTLRKATISNLDEVLKELAFLSTKEIAIEIPKSINGYFIPADLNFKSICRFEDIKAIAQSITKKEGEKMPSEHFKKYADIVGVYAMPDYENASLKDRSDFAKQFLKSPCGEVMAIGNFTLMKLTGLSQPVSSNFLKVITLMHKFRLVLKGYSARLGFTLRYFIWKTRHRIKETSS